MLCMLMIVFLFIVSLTLSSIIMSITLSSLLWVLRSLRYYEPHALFVIMSLTLSSLLWASRSLLYYVFMLYVLQFKLYTPILCKSCFLTLYSYSLQIMLSSNTMNQSTWNFIILLCIIKSQLQHTFRYFKSIQNLSFMHHFITLLIFQHNWNYLKHPKHTC
jgi:hypothetical protein